MSNDKTICRLVIQICTVVFGLVFLDATYRIPFYPWSVRSNARPIVRSTNLDRPISMNYKLDTWSQYDNPEEGTAREGDIKERTYSRKTTTTDENLLWPDGIVFYLVDDVIGNDSEKLSILENAMENIMEETCVRFVRVYPDENGQISTEMWVNITGNDEGCYSDLGRSEFSPSSLNLDVARCFRTRGHAIHEILHTLGVYHEHMRPDRDDHIEILWENIKDGDEFNFRMMDKGEVTNYGLPYDYDSIMHYSMTAFSKDKSFPTIVPRKEGAEIGQRDHLSFYDIQKLLITYKCEKKVDQHGNEDEEQLIDSKVYISENFIENDDDKNAKISDFYDYERSIAPNPTTFAQNPLAKFYYPVYLINPMNEDHCYCYNYYYYY